MEKIDFLNQEKSAKTIHNPWLKLAGKYKDDRDFDKVLTYSNQESFMRNQLLEKNIENSITIAYSLLG